MCVFFFRLLVGWCFAGIKMNWDACDRRISPGNKLRDPGVVVSLFVFSCACIICEKADVPHKSGANGERELNLDNRFSFRFEY